MFYLEPRLEGDPRKGHYWTQDARTFWGCPECGQAHELTTHTINDCGHVAPSVVCGKCDFHEYVCLEECSPEARQNADLQNT